jgi:hypothetical protein
MGIGFARESRQQPRGKPAYNAFLNLTSVATSGGAPQPLPGGWRVYRAYRIINAGRRRHRLGAKSSWCRFAPQYRRLSLREK